MIQVKSDNGKLLYSIFTNDLKRFFFSKNVHSYRSSLFKYKYIGRHMAVTPFKFPPLFRKPKNVEIPKRLGVRAVVVDSSNNFLLTLQGILNPDLSLMFRKMQVIK